MFSNCFALVSLNIDKFNTEKAANMSSMFNNLKSLKSLHLNDLFITKNVLDVSYM